MPLNIRMQWNAGTACVSECMLKTLVCWGLRVGPSKLQTLLEVEVVESKSRISSSVGDFVPPCRMRGWQSFLRARPVPQPTKTRLMHYRESLVEKTEINICWHKSWAPRTKSGAHSVFLGPSFQRSPNLI